MMNNKYKIVIAFATPILIVLIGSMYFQYSRSQYMNELASRGVLAVYSKGEVSEQDIKWYIHFPPQTESPILRALELTPEDVEGLEREQPDWLEQELAQALLKRIIQHITLIKILNAQVLDKDKTVESNVRQYKETLMKQKMESELNSITPTITRQEMLTYYVQHPNEFYEPGDRLARHIMLSDDSEPANASISVASIEAKLKHGEDFLSLVQYSQSDTASSDGYLGWIEEGVTAKPFERALWALDVYEVTGPIQVGNTWHFIQLLDKHEQGLIPFEKCQSQIQVKLIEEKSLQHRLKLLGITSSETANAEEQYSKALLKSAYDKEYDKDELIQQKTEAYQQYIIADTLFTHYTAQRMNTERDEDESTWFIESETAKNLLNKAGFQMVVELAPSQPSPEDEIFMDSPLNED